MLTRILLIHLLAATSALALEPKQLVGEWSRGGYRNIVGEGHERRMVFQIRNGNLELIFKTLRYVRNMRTPPEEKSSLPHRVKKLTSNRMIYVRDGNEYHVTIRFHADGVLEWGALVSDDNKDWRYAKEVPTIVPKDKKPRVKQGMAHWTFANDPFKVPVGKAGVPGIRGEHAYYIHEKLPSYETGGVPERSIRVMTLNEDGSLSEQFRMVWTKKGGPYFEGTFSRGLNVHSLKTEILRRLPGKK